MIRTILHPLRALTGRFCRSEDGVATVEFAITFPIFMIVLASGVELGVATLQHSMLERAVDMTVRDIRLGTGNDPQHDAIKANICDLAGFIEDCNENLWLEMIQVDPRNWTGITADATCTDQSEEVDPVLTFVAGQENDLMIIRACIKISPIFPTSGLGSALFKDAAGQYALVSTSAFVQEPR